eukprot:277350_1
MHTYLTATLIILAYSFAHSSDDFDSLEIENGHRNFTTYYQGNAPVIVVSQHEGFLKPDDIPDRTYGCWNTTSQQCIWEYNCSENTGFNKSSTNCYVFLGNDGNTQEIARCLYENIDIFGNNKSRPHYILNHLHKIKFQGNVYADDIKYKYQWDIPDLVNVYNDLWYNFLQQARNSTMNDCGFGLMIDIHGSAHKFDQLGYRIGRSGLQDDAILNKQGRSTNLESLVYTNIQNDSVAEIVRGEYAIGTIMNETYGFKITPSRKQPNPVDWEGYFQSGFAANLAGSQDGGTVDSIHIEVGIPTKNNKENRDKFCIGLSRSIEIFINYYYNVSRCNGYGESNEDEISTTNDEISTTTKFDDESFSNNVCLRVILIVTIVCIIIL